jgi:hypothetical protein
MFKKIAAKVHEFFHAKIYGVHAEKLKPPTKSIFIV